MGILDRFRRRPKSANDDPDPAASTPERPVEPTVEDLYLTVRAPVFRDPYGDAPAPLDPHGELIRAAFLAGDLSAGWQFRPELDLLQPWLVRDDPNTGTEVVTDELLEQLGLDRPAAIAQARSNTAALLDQGEITISAGGPAGSFAIFGYPHERRAALLTVPEVFEPWRDKVPGELLVLPGSDNDIMLIGSEAEYVGVAVRSAIGDFNRAGAKRLSPIPYAIVDGELRPWLPAADDDVIAAIAEAEVVQRVSGYAGFTDTLAEQLTPVEVSRAERGASESTGTPFSYTFTSLVGPSTRLPFVDYLGLENLEPQQDGFVWVPFAALAEIDGLELTPSWQYGLPVLAFTPPTDRNILRQVSTAVLERAEDPWA